MYLRYGGMFFGSLVPVLCLSSSWVRNHQCYAIVIQPHSSSTHYASSESIYFGIVDLL